MKTILVSGASGIVGYGILRSLRQSGLGYRLIGTSIYERSIASAFCDIFIKAPVTDAENYMPWLLDVIKNYKVDMIIPSIELDVAVWNQNRAKLDESGAFVLLNNSRLIELCADKWLFYLELEKCGSPYAIPTSLSEEFAVKFPVLLKPRSGSASKGIVIASSNEELQAFSCRLGPELILQPIIGHVEEEYSTSAFYDKENQLLAHMTVRRKLSKQGFTEIAEVAHPMDLEVMLNELAEIFKPVGPTNFQFRLDGSQIKLLEINPRISSATSIRTAFGYNESHFSVEYFLNDIPPSQPAIQNGYAVRYTEDMIFYDSSDL